MAGRLAAFQVSRRGAHAAGVAHQPLGHQGSVLRRADGNRHVHVVEHHIHIAVAQRQLHRDVGVQLGKFRHQRRDAVAPQADGGAYLEHAPGHVPAGTDIGNRFVELAEQGIHPHIQRLALAGEPEAPRVTHQHPHAELLLDARDILTDGRHGKTQIIGRFGKTPRLHDRHKHTEISYPFHRRILVLRNRGTKRYSGSFHLLFFFGVLIPSGH